MQAHRSHSEPTSLLTIAAGFSLLILLLLDLALSSDWTVLVAFLPILLWVPALVWRRTH